MVKVFDNGGASFDRYTIVTKDALYTMSPNPLSPSGFNQFSHELGEGQQYPTYEPNNSEKEITLRDTPVDVLVAIINRLEND